MVSKSGLSRLTCAHLWRDLNSRRSLVLFRRAMCLRSCPDISLARGGASDMIRLLNANLEVKILQDVKGHIRLQDVHFRYPTCLGIHVLHGLDLSVKPGTYVALVGASGSGKSTV